MPSKRTALNALAAHYEVPRVGGGNTLAHVVAHIHFLVGLVEDVHARPIPRALLSPLATACGVRMPGGRAGYTLFDAWHACANRLGVEVDAPAARRRVVLVHRRVPREEESVEESEEESEEESDEESLAESDSDSVGSPGFRRDFSYVEWFGGDPYGSNPEYAPNAPQWG